MSSLDNLVKTMGQLDMKDFVYPNKPSACTWHVNADASTSPHTKVPYVPHPKVLPDILHHIGNTPMVKLNKIPKTFDIKCEMLGKCEFFNPGGSVKDRIGYRMIEDAEKKGKLKPGSVIIEPTSGNTGIGLALAAAVKGYRCIIVMPEKMSNEKVDVLKALGAEITRTPTAAAFDSPEGLVAVAQKLNKEIPNSIILNQYTNAGNPLAHYDLTAEEIYDQCDGKLDMVVVCAGTGGTISGIGRRLKELCPKCIIVGADPLGSILAEPPELNKTDVSYYEVEGIGYDFNPTVLDKTVVDRWVKTNDKDSIPMARRLIKEEGLLCGGSSGTAMSVAVKVAAELKEGQRCVVLLPDGIRNYMTKFLADQWMEARDLKPVENKPQHWWWNSKLSGLHWPCALQIAPELSCQETLTLLKTKGVDEIPVVQNETGKILGVITTTHLMTSLSNTKVALSDAVGKCLVTKFVKVPLDTTSVGKASRILEKEPFILIVEKDAKKGTEVLKGVLKPVDVLNFITSTNKKMKNCQASSS